MKRVLFVMVVCMLVAGAVPCSAQFWYGDNVGFYNLSTYRAGSEQVTLVPNGDFENGSTSWTLDNSAVETAPVGVPAAFGAKSLVVHPEPAPSSQNNYQILTLNEGVTYVGSAYMINLGSQTKHLLPVLMVFRAEPWTLMLKLSVWWDIGGVNDNIDYYFAKGEFTAPATEQYYVMCSYNENPGGSGWQVPNAGAVWDNVAITRLADFRNIVVPEPGALSVLGFGLMGLALRRIRR